MECRPARQYGVLDCDRRAVKRQDGPSGPSQWPCKRLPRSPKEKEINFCGDGSNTILPQQRRAQAGRHTHAEISAPAVAAQKRPCRIPIWKGMSCAMMGRFGRRWIVGTCATMISAAGPYGGGDDFVIIYLEKKSSPLKKGLKKYYHKVRATLLLLQNLFH